MGFIAALLLAAAAGAQTANEAYQRGVALLQQGHAAEAVTPLREAAGRDGSARNWKALGVALASLENYREAEPAFREACRLDPKDEANCYYLGRSLYALDRYEDSLKALETALPVHPRRWRTELAMAQAYEALGKAKEAEQRFRAAVKLAPPRPQQPDFDNPQVDYGLFLYRQSRIEEALRSYADGVRRAPESGRAQYQFGRALLQAGRLEDAASHLEAAVRVEPDNREAHLALSRVYFRLGRSDDGERHSRLGSPEGSSTVR